MSSSNRYLWVRSHRHHVPVGQQDPRRHSFTTSIYDKRAIDEKKAVSEIQCVPLLNVAATSRMHSAEIARMPRRRRRRRRRRYLPYADNNKHRTTSRLAHTSERCVFWFHTPIRALCCTVIAFAPFARDPRQAAVAAGALPSPLQWVSVRQSSRKHPLLAVFSMLPCCPFKQGPPMHHPFHPVTLFS